MLSTEKIIRLEFDECKNMNERELEKWMDEKGHKIKWINQKELSDFIERIFVYKDKRINKNFQEYLDSIVDYFNCEFNLNCFEDERKN